ncbi:MAG: hypothetical protein JNN07_27130 [Verrucomicrobiales bacterium]|nr:hypothetical protein [Verrucomicrobiales bacterium]
MSSTSPIEDNLKQPPEFYDAATSGDMDTVRQMIANDPAVVRSKIELEFTALT